MCVESFTTSLLLSVCHFLYVFSVRIIAASEFVVECCCISVIFTWFHGLCRTLFRREFFCDARL